MAGRKRIDLTGQRFVRLLVIRPFDKKSWVARCDCGTEKAVNTSALRRNTVRSCGCLRTELLTRLRPSQKVWPYGLSVRELAEQRGLTVQAVRYRLQHHIPLDKPRRGSAVHVPDRLDHVLQAMDQATRASA